MDIETTDNVVSLSTRRPMSPGKLREVEAYWMALADGRLMPKRSEVDPRGMTGSLDRVFLLEKMSPAQARFRVAGSRLSRLLEMDLRGMPFSSLFHPTARPDVSDALMAVFADPARVQLRLDGMGGGVFTNRISAEVLILPLRDDAGEVTRALGVIDWEGEVCAPNRFRIAHQQRRTLIGYGVRPDEQPDALDFFGQPEIDNSVFVQSVTEDNIDASDLELVTMRDTESGWPTRHARGRRQTPKRPNLTVVT